MNFADITDITIPEGSVEKITETISGRVLWEKNKIVLNPAWRVQNVESIAYTGDINDCKISSLGISYSGNNPASEVASIGVMIHNDNQVGDTLIYGKFNVEDKITFKTLGSNTVATSNKLSTLAMPKQMPSHGGGAILVKSSNSIYGNGAYLLAAPNLMNGNLTGGYATTSSPVSDTSVTITYSPERNELLMTGFSNGLMVLELGVLSSQVFHSSSLRKTCWASGLGTSGLYFGATGNDGNVSYSTDGINWQTSTVYQTSNGSKVLDFAYLSQKKQICAISSNSTNIALSSDGQTWKYKQAPTNKASLCAYSPKYDALCIWDNVNQKAYVTRNFETWEEATIPNTSNVNLRDLLYVREGVFVGYEYLGRKLYFLSIYYPFG